MAVTETTAETDGSLTAVTVAETETDCRPTDNDSIKVNEACALKPWNQTTHNRRHRVPGLDRRHGEAGCETRKKDGMQCYQVLGRLYQLVQAPP